MGVGRATEAKTQTTHKDREEPRKGGGERETEPDRRVSGVPRYAFILYSLRSRRTPLLMSL